MVTQKQIAEKVGVSRTAVASVLNRNSRIKIGNDLRRRILTTATELGYRPCRYAQALRGKRSGLVGMFQFGSLFQTAMERALHVAKAVYESGYQLVAGDVLWHDGKCQSVVEMFLDARVEGIVVIGGGSEMNLNPLREARIPVVAINSPGLEAEAQVMADVRQGMFDLTRHVLSLGYQRIVLMTAALAPNDQRPYRLPIAERVHGFKAAVAQRASTRLEAEIVAAPRDDASYWLDPYLAGQETMASILTNQRLPEAVLCSNDDWALGALSACAKAGVAVPRDLALTGYDNTLMGNYCPVPLTSVAQPNEPMARQAVALLLRIMRGENPAAAERQIRLPCRLVVRESCGAVLRGPGAHPPAEAV